MVRRWWFDVCHGAVADVPPLRGRRATAPWQMILPVLRTENRHVRMVTCRIKTATRRRGREGRGEGVEWWQEEECGRRSAGLKPYIILQQRGPRNMSLFRGPLCLAEFYCNLMSVMTCAPTAWFRASTSWSRRMCSSVRSTGEVRLTCRHWLRIYIWRVHRAAAGPATSVQACIRRYSLSGLSRPL